jgi:hypothetical protein
MSISFVSLETRAYLDGYRAGRGDRLLGRSSRYILGTKPHEGVYLWRYAMGYKVALRGEGL